MTALSAWFFARTMRERVLIGLAGALTAILLLVFAIVLPVGAWHDSARLRHEAAITNAARVQAMLAALDRQPAGATDRGGGALDTVVAADADAAGLPLQANTATGNAGTGIVISGAQPAAILGWLARLEARGILVEQLSIQPMPGGTVNASATLRRAGA